MRTFLHDGVPLRVGKGLQGTTQPAYVKKLLHLELLDLHHVPESLELLRFLALRRVPFGGSSDHGTGFIGTGGSGT